MSQRENGPWAGTGTGDHESSSASAPQRGSEGERGLSGRSCCWGGEGWREGREMKPPHGH